MIIAVVLPRPLVAASLASQPVALLTDISRSIANDGQIVPEEAENIRQSWETLKSHAESFVIAAERALYQHRPPGPR